MKKEDIVIGMEVLWKGDLEDTYIVMSLPNDRNIVEIKSKNDESFCHSSNVKLLVTREELKKDAQKIQEKVNKTKNALEEAFQSLQKVKGCGYSPYELESLGLVSFSELAEIMEKNGWSSSSLFC